MNLTWFALVLGIMKILVVLDHFTINLHTNPNKMLMTEMVNTINQHDFENIRMNQIINFIVFCLQNQLLHRLTIKV